ncbi:hypothetical protein ASPCAL14721 [Aspergillus calidoustus]|uniref:BTB domain-containing protein n=1 Tax=Aspergillus calidoustus TaxID=454130 RepID=A0A0U4ZQJ6_ASPCI|nr:hypothetical protein ASPCAL14721 [Aspergillus calidoustus]
MAPETRTGPMPQAAPEIMDPDGDVVINCSGVCFLVSSKAVSLASPVFRAMFTSKFKEGVTLRAPSSSDGRANIELPSDNADAFRVFAYYAHHNVEALPSTISPDILLALAIFLDKYACAALLMHTCEAWSEQCLKGASKKVSGNSYRRPKLDKLQTSIARRTENALMDPVWKVTHTDCNRLKNTLFEYTKALKEREILPGTARYHHRSIAQVHQAAEGLSTRQGRPKHISYRDDCGCRDCVEHNVLVNELESRMKKATDSVKWCLLCLKGPRCSKHPPATTK